MNTDTFVSALGKEGLVRGEEKTVGCQGSVTSSFHCHSRSTGDREIRQLWRRRGAVSKQGFELSFHTPGASWGSKAVVVRELLLFLPWGKVNRWVQLGAGGFSVTSPQDTVEERMKLYRFGVLSISSPHGQNTGPILCT